LECGHKEFNHKDSKALKSIFELNLLFRLSLPALKVRLWRIDYDCTIIRMLFHLAHSRQKNYFLLLIINHRVHRDHREI